MGPLLGGAAMGLDQTFLIASVGTALAFVAEAWLFHHLSMQAFAALRGAGYFLGSFGVYAILRSPKYKGLAIASVFLGAFFVGAQGQIQLVSAGLAFLLLVAYPRYLRRGLLTKPLAIVGVWLLALHAFTGASAAWLYLQQGVLLGALTLPFDMVSTATDRIPTFPRAFGIAKTRVLYYALLGASAVGVLGSPAPFRLALWVTLLSAGLLMLWPLSLTAAGVSLYDVLLVFQALVVYATQSLVLLPICAG